MAEGFLSRRGNDPGAYLVYIVLEQAKAIMSTKLSIFLLIIAGIFTASLAGLAYAQLPLGVTAAIGAKAGQVKLLPAFSDR